MENHCTHWKWAFCKSTVKLIHFGRYIRAEPEQIRSGWRTFVSVKRLLSQCAVWSLLVAFVVTTSGWVLHTHYCPESSRRVFSLLSEAACRMPEQVPVSSCCTPPSASPVCGLEAGCCQDIQIVLSLSGPYYPSSLSPLTPEPPQDVCDAGVVLFERTNPLVELTRDFRDGPPPATTGERLNRLQVYRI